MGDAPTAVGMAAFLRDLTEITTKQQSTVEAQTANGFVHWLGTLPDRQGIRSAFVERPDAVPASLVEVRPPHDQEPSEPRRLSEEDVEALTDAERAAYLDEHARYQKDAASWRAHKALYDDLFGARTPAEDMELVFALGFVVTPSDRGTLRRHLVTVPAGIELDRSAQTLRVVLIDAPRTELNWTDSATRTALNDAERPLQDLLDAQTLAEATTALDEIRASFGTRGVTLASASTPPGPGNVGLAPMPALLLRKRDSSYLLQLLRDMTDDLAAGGFVSEPFQMIVSPTYQPPRRDVLSERAALPLPANEEQRVMIDSARREPHLVIQGPPGTGKTHTIANLAAVLMAEGRRVLVTAENERALSEVQAKLPADMRPLMLPMLREGGTGPLQASVNKLTAEASSKSTPETRARRQADALKRLEAVDEAITAAEQRLAAIAQEDHRARTFGTLTMPVAGHLIALRERSGDLHLVEEFLSSDGILQAEDAHDLVALRSVVTETHQDLATHRFPEGLMEPSELARWLDEHRSQLAVLGDPSEFDYSELADSVDALVRLAMLLQELPPTGWSSINRTSEEYTAASSAVAAVASDLDHSVTVDPSHATSDAITLCEEYLALDETRFDAPPSQLLDQHRAATGHAAGSAVRGEFERQDRADELTRACQDAIELLRRDRSGLLPQHVLDHRTHGRSSVDDLIREAADLVEGSRDAVGLEVTFAEGAPAFHELAAQAEILSTHLAGGGKMTGLVRQPKPVRDAEDLIKFVKVGGSEVDTLPEAERARDHLRYRTRITMIDSWAASHGLQRPAGTTHHDWLVALVGIPVASEQVRAACKQAEEFVRFPFGTAPDEPGAFLAAALASVSREVAEALDGFARVAANAPTIRLTGLPIRNRTDAQRALAAIQASVLRTSRATMLPESWQDRCNPVDTDDGDLLAEMLAVCAAAAEVPGPARTANLTPSAVNGIAERAQRDRRRSELLQGHERVMGGLRRTLIGCVPQSPATKAITEAVRNEDPITYRQGMEALDAEMRMAAEATRLNATRAAVERAHPSLLVALDIDDQRALDVVSNITEYERLRDHQKAARGWLDQVGSADAVHTELRKLHLEARTAEQRLSGLRCWDKAVERLQERRELRASLSALTGAMDAVPKTRTAKSYPARLRALRAATTDAAPAIPCWVMTVDRVAEVLGYPTGEDRFDVVIIDEASQAWFPAIFLYAIADQVIVVGDKLQTSPATVPISVDQVAAIAREHISGHRLENRVGDDLSLYDVAEAMTGPDMMVDHFRCVPEIIDISNRLSYAPMGRPLQPSRVREPGTLQPVLFKRTVGHRRGSEGANEAEVEAIVDQVVRCHADPAYRGLDFGVVVVGPSPTAHLKLLRTRLLDELGAEAMRERDLEVGTASQFQGAERHVMFLSLVVAPIDGERIRVWPHEHSGQNRRNVQQLNVAVSRARDQLWIFHSFDPAQLPPDDARGVIFETLPTEPSSIDAQLAACDSQFERDVVTAIAAADASLVVKTQVEALGYSIDIVVEDRDGHRLAVECDGDRWHSSDSQIRSDLYRQRTLEAIGWRFHRFLASEWYDDPERHLRTVLDELRRSKAPKTTRLTADQSTSPSEPGIVGQSTDPEAPAPTAPRSPRPRSIDDDLVDDESQWDMEDPSDWEDDSDLVADLDDLTLLEEEVDLLAAVDELLFGQDEDVGRSDQRDGGHGGTAPTAEAPGASTSRLPGVDHPAPIAPMAGPLETLTCESCGQQWTRPLRRGRKPSRCPSCTAGRPAATGASTSVDTGMTMKEQNRRLAAALRDLGKEPNGPVWARAKELFAASGSFEDAARKA
jgi:very-short-patch-repair endonuclease/DNA polymerase III delta prime subunit